MTGGIATALTLARNFGPWFAGVALVAFLAGGAAGFKGGRMWSADDVREAEAAQHVAETSLTTFKKDLADAKVSVLTEQQRLQGVATDATAAAIARGVEQLTGEIRASSDRSAIDTLNRNILTLQKDANYACRDLPLPAFYLDSLRIPRDQAGATTGNGN